MAVGKDPWRDIKPYFHTLGCRFWEWANMEQFADYYERDGTELRNLINYNNVRAPQNPPSCTVHILTGHTLASACPGVYASPVPCRSLPSQYPTLLTDC